MYDEEALFNEVMLAARAEELEKLAFVVPAALGGVYGHKSVRKKDRVEGALLGAAGATAGAYAGAFLGALALGIPTAGILTAPGYVGGAVVGGMKGAKWATADLRREKERRDRKKRAKKNR